MTKPKARQVALKGVLAPKKNVSVNLNETEAERRVRWKSEAALHGYKQSMWKRSK